MVVEFVVVFLMGRYLHQYIFIHNKASIFICIYIYTSIFDHHIYAYIYIHMYGHDILITYTHKHRILLVLVR